MKGSILLSMTIIGVLAVAAIVIAQTKSARRMPALATLSNAFSVKEDAAPYRPPHASCSRGDPGWSGYGTAGWHRLCSSLQ